MKSLLGELFAPNDQWLLRNAYVESCVRRLRVSETSSPSCRRCLLWLKGLQLAIDELAKENPKAKDITPQELMDLNSLP
jgi:hypothetical protein